MKWISEIPTRVAEASRDVKPLGKVFEAIGYQQSPSGAKRIIALAVLIPAGMAVIYPFLFMGRLYFRYGSHIFK